jgi:hypothetical protein
VPGASGFAGRALFARLPPDQVRGTARLTEPLGSRERDAGSRPMRVTIPSRKKLGIPRQGRSCDADRLYLFDLPFEKNLSLVVGPIS